MAQGWSCSTRRFLSAFSASARMRSWQKPHLMTSFRDMVSTSSGRSASGTFRFRPAPLPSAASGEGDPSSVGLCFSSPYTVAHHLPP